MVLRKLGLVIWKNLILRKRHWILTTFEIIIPAALFILASVVMSEIKINKYDTKYNDITEESTLYSKLQSTPLLYAPYNNFTQSLMEDVRNSLTQPIQLVSFTSEEQLLSYYFSLANYGDTVCGIVFENLPITDDVQHLQYKIRISDASFSTSLAFGMGFTNEAGTPEAQYLDNSFVPLQLLIDKAFMKRFSIDTSLYEFHTQKFPHPEYEDDFILTLFSVLLPFFTVISFALICPSILKNMVVEKETGVKELMKMMGLKDWMLWLGWLINALLVNIISITIITILLKINSGQTAILQHADGFLLWLFLLFYSISGTVFVFAISSFFYRPTLAMSIGIILWNLSYSTFSYLVTTDADIGLGSKMLSALLPNVAMSWGYRLMMEYETKHIGMGWDNFFEPPSVGGDLTIGHVWVMFIVDIFVYGAIAWYIDKTMPGKYGVAKPWYFIFMPSYWCSSKVNDMSSSEKVSFESTKFEKPPSNASVGIKIENLRKVFQTMAGTNKKVAVDGVTLDIYKGQITALLGHNGAGKTTTMSIITGLISPTSGSVHVDGYDIHENLAKVRETLGLCPQHNLLFTDLTVMEHLVFFAMLKGLSKQEAEYQASSLLSKLNLSEKKNNMCATLSGGMKRKLSLGIAIIGHTKVLMLDEPTSGMDPEARREMWDILLKMRGERTILITTHFMEEADVLGDRIAIMDHGQVQCYGTSLFLKKLYGTGYQLNILKEEHCNVANITNTIQRIISEAKIKGEMGSFLSYMLPSHYSSHFPQLFEVLERDKHMLGISSLGVSITTLEEVFLRVGMDSEERENRKNNVGSTSNSEINHNYTKHNGHSEAQAFKRRDGTGLMIQQLTALLKKRIIFVYRRWISFVIQALIAIMMAILTMTLSDTATARSVQPALTLDLNFYGTTEVLFFDENESFKTSYESKIRSENSNPQPVKQVNEELLNVARYDLNEYFEKYVIATEFNDSSSPVKVNALFSSKALHSPAISLNILTNTILEKENTNKSITVINHPLEDREDIDSSETDSLGLLMLWMSVMPFGLLFLTGIFMRFPLMERVSKAKQLQLMSGVSPLLYWLSCFICDIIFYLLIVAVIILMVFVADPLDIFTGSSELGTCFLLLFMYGFAAIPFIYMFSFLRKTNAGGFSLLIMFNMLFGMILSLVVYFMLQDDDYEAAGNGLKYVLEFVPHFAVTFGLMRYASNVYNNGQCKIKNVDCNINKADFCCLANCDEKWYCPGIHKPYLEVASDANPNGVGVELLYLAIDTVLYICLIMMIEYDVFTKLHAFLMKSSIGTAVENETLEEDVMKEKERIKMVTAGGCSDSEDILLVDDVVKKFTVNFAPVKGVSFGVNPGECFGLLGVNGAGKTTTFRMLTGDEWPSAGNAWIGQCSLTKGKAKFLSQIGYCPQFDAINEALTGREMLALFASLRGVSQYWMKFEVDKWLSLLGLDEYKDRQCGTYSGGNKRKLSTAMALIGDPAIIFLDEPTSGVDPIARRNLWTVLTSIQKSGQSVVLTSHSMEECEALCNRLAIMVSGQFKCMGGIQYLKQKFGQGFTIMIKLEVSGFDEHNLNRLKHEILENFKTGCVLKDEHQGLLHYHVTDPNVPWNHLFTAMEYLKQNHSIVEDYTISETTLEQVFLSFARAQPQEMSTDL